MVELLAQGIGILAVLMPAIVNLLAEHHAKVQAAQPGERRDQIDRVLTGGNAVGIGQLLDKLFNQSKDRNRSAGK